MTCQTIEMNICISTQNYLIEVPTSPVGSPPVPRLLDRYSLDELEEVNKQLFAELGMSTPYSSPERALNTNPNRDGYNLEDDPEEWLILDLLLD